MQIEKELIMFTTGNNIYLYATVVLYAAVLVLFLFKQRAAFYILLPAFILHLLFVAGRAWLGGMFLPNPITEGPYFMPLCVGFIALLMGYKKDPAYGYILILAVLFSSFSIAYAKGILPPTPNKITLWVPAFFFTENIAHACFYCGAVYALISLFKKDVLFHDFLIWGFVFYSIAQVVGAVWCYNGWGNTFRWSERHMMSAAIWLFYAAYIHLRFMINWDQKRKAYFDLAGAVIVLASSFSYYIKELMFPRIGG